MFTPSEVIVLTNKQTDAAENTRTLGKRSVAIPIFTMKIQLSRIAVEIFV